MQCDFTSEAALFPKMTKIVMDRNTSYPFVLLDFSLTVKAAPHECVIRTSQP